MDDTRQKSASLPRILQNLFRAGNRSHVSSSQQPLPQNSSVSSVDRACPVSPTTSEPSPIANQDIFYFLHIPKTAGTSVRAYLVEAFGPDAILNASFLGQIMTMDRALLRKHKLIVGHFFGLLDPYLGRKTRKITFLRNPFARAVSHVLHARRHPSPHLAEDLRPYSLEQALTSPGFAWLHQNYQARCLASLAFSANSLPEPVPGSIPSQHLLERLHHDCLSANRLFDVAKLMLDQMDFVGLSEHLPQSLCGVAAAWNLPVPQRTYLENQNPQPLDYSSLVSDSVRQEFQRQNEIDYELNSLVRKRLLGES